MRRVVIVVLALAFTGSAIPATAQQKPGADPAREAERSKVARSVTGTVKTTTDSGLVVVGRETGGNDKEWTFAVDRDTRVDSGGKAKTANELRAGDSVTVTYTNRDGKIVAQSVKVNAR
jgi:Domain of unknown function (DUF5666)